jgi:membrane protein
MPWPILSTSKAEADRNMGRVRTVSRVVVQTATAIGDDEMMTRAAALAFYAALSFAPLLVLTLWLVSSLDPGLQDTLVSGLADLVGEQAAGTADLVIANAQNRPGFGNVAGIVSLAVTLFAASAVFAQLQGALNRIWGLRPRPGRAWLGWLRSRAQAIGLLLTLVFLLVISLSISAVIAIYVPGDTLAWRGIEATLSFAVFVVVFASIYKVLPDAIIRWSDALVGATLTALLFALGKLGIGLYLDHSNVGGAYGPAGAVIVLLVWVYYSGIILLLGAELTNAVATARGMPIIPSAHAVALNRTDASRYAGASADTRRDAVERDRGRDPDP